MGAGATGTLISYVFFAAISAAMCGYVAHDKARTTPAWALAGLFIPFLPLLALIAVTNRRELAIRAKQHQELIDAIGGKAAAPKNDMQKQLDRQIETGRAGPEVSVMGKPLP